MAVHERRLKIMLATNTISEDNLRGFKKKFLKRILFIERQYGRNTDWITQFKQSGYNVCYPNPKITMKRGVKKW